MKITQVMFMARNPKWCADGIFVYMIGEENEIVACAQAFELLKLDTKNFDMYKAVPKLHELHKVGS